MNLSELVDFNVTLNYEGVSIQHQQYTVAIGVGPTVDVAMADWREQVDKARTWLNYTDVTDEQVAAFGGLLYIPAENWIARFGRGIVTACARNEVNPCHPEVRQFITEYYDMPRAPNIYEDVFGRRMLHGPPTVSFGANSISIDWPIERESQVSAAWRMLYTEGPGLEGGPSS